MRGVGTSPLQINTGGCTNRKKHLTVSTFALVLIWSYFADALILDDEGDLTDVRSNDAYELRRRRACMWKTAVNTCQAVIGEARWSDLLRLLRLLYYWLACWGWGSGHVVFSGLFVDILIFDHLPNVSVTTFTARLPHFNFIWLVRKYCSYPKNGNYYNSELRCFFQTHSGFWSSEVLPEVSSNKLTTCKKRVGN